MAILIDIGHPAHVHFFKNFIWDLQNCNTDFVVTTREKEMNLKLLEYYGIPYLNMGKNKKSMVGKALGLVRTDLELLRIIKKHKVTTMTGIGSPYIATVGRLANIRSIVFTDSEPVKLDRYLVYPFASTIVTPEFFRKALGPRQVRYSGCHELAYLRDFKMAPRIQRKYGGKRFVIMRFVSWSANHDVGQKGFTIDEKCKMIKEVEKKGYDVVVSSETREEDLEDYTLHNFKDIANIHTIMAMAKLCVCDSQTMATESALLGIPTIRCNSWIGKNDMGIFIALQKRKMLTNVGNPKKVLELLPKFLDNSEELGADRKEKARKFMRETVDVNELIKRCVLGRY